MMVSPDLPGTNTRYYTAQADNRPSKSSPSKTQQPQRPRCKPPPEQPEGTDLRPHYTFPTANSSARKRSLSKPLLPSETSSPSSPSSSRTRFNNVLPSTIFSPRIAETDPERTTQLWRTVMLFVSDIAGTREERVRRIIPSTSKSPTLLSTLESGQRRQQTHPTSASTSTGAKRETIARVADRDFPESILEPYGISIRGPEAKRDLPKHFRILALPSEPQYRLDVYKREFSLNVWLDPNIERLKQEYHAMQVYGSNEAEYSSFALSNIFLDEPRYPWLPQHKGEQRWLPIRLLQFVHKPQKEWHAPPLIHTFRKTYNWDVRPDCAYYVSLQAFEASNRMSVYRHISVMQRRAFCPYLTIQFKKDKGSHDTVTRQAAISSTLALYNRYRLKRRALEKSKQDWTDEHERQMRHYSITFAGSYWDLWCTVPKTFEEWTGCNMSNLCSGSCSVLADVQKLVSIVNDIHYWGLKTHGHSCKADIYTEMNSTP